MYLIRRVAKTQPGKAWEVAGYLSKICKAYEEGGRNEARVYIQGVGVPGPEEVVYADWVQERIEPIVMGMVPEAVHTNHAKMEPLLTQYSLEFYEMVTPEKLRGRGLV